MDTLIHSLVSGTNVVNSEEIANQFAKTLTEDRHKLDGGQGEAISDSAIYAPKLGKPLDKQFDIAHLIARKCFSHVAQGDDVQDQNSSNTRKWQYILYKRLLRDLRNTLREHGQESAAAAKNKQPPPKKTPSQCQHRPHKDAPLSEIVLEPTAMPVDIPPVEEFEPFLAFLELNQELGPDDGDAYLYTPNNTRILRFKRGAVYADQRLDLCKQVVGPTHITRLMSSLRKSQQIVHFLLGNNIIGGVGAQAIADFIGDGTNTTSQEKDRDGKRSPEIKTWYLAGNAIDEEGMALIARALETDTFCRSLWLKRNPIKQGVKHLAQTFTVNHTIKILDLSNTGILDEGAELLFTALSTNRGLRFLYLDANGLTGKTAGCIAEYVRKLTREGRKGVTSLWLTMNRFYDDFIPALRTLGAYEHLKRLNVGSGRLGPASAQAMYEAFARHTRLKVLDVSMYKATYDMGELPNALGDEGAKWLSMLIEENRSVLDVAVQGSGMTAAGFNLLARAVEQNDRILFLDHTQELHVEKDVRDSISRSLDRNLRVHCCGGGEYAADDLSPSSSRRSGRFDGLVAFKKRLRHGKYIFDIDSVYRNRTKL